MVASQVGPWRGEVRSGGGEGIRPRPGSGAVGGEIRGKAPVDAGVDLARTFFLLPHLGVEPDLVPEGLEGSDRIAGGEVEDEGENAGALDVAEESDAEAAVEMRALDEAGDIGNGEAGAGLDGDLFLGEAELRGGRVADKGPDGGTARVLVEDDGSDVGLEGGEGPVADAGAAVAEGAKEGALAGIGEADEADVGEELELELDAEGDGLLALCGEEGPGVLARDKVGVSQAADAAGGEEDGLRGGPAEVELYGAGGLGEEALATGQAGEDDVSGLALGQARVQNPLVLVRVVRVDELAPLFLGEGFLAALGQDLSPLRFALGVPNLGQHGLLGDGVLAAHFPHHGPDGDGDDDVVALLPRLGVAAARFAAAGAHEAAAGNLVQGGLSADGLDVHVAAMAAVAAVGGPVGEVGFAEKRDAAGAAGAGVDVELGLVGEVGGRVVVGGGVETGAGEVFGGGGGGGVGREAARCRGEWAGGN